MNRSYKFRLTHAWGVAAAFTSLVVPNAAQAQTTQAGGTGDRSFDAHIRAICPVLGGQRADGSASATATDLFYRCNNVLATTVDGATSAGSVSNQISGLQNLSSQSDGAVAGTRDNRAAVGRISALSGQVRGGNFAGNSTRTVLLAANDPDALDLSSSPRDGNLDFYASAGGFTGSQDVSVNELGFDTDGFWISGGADYAFGPNMIAGVNLSYMDSEIAFDDFQNSTIGGSSSTSAAGDMTSEGFSFAAYGVLFPTTQVELNALISLGQMDYELSRFVSIEDRNANVTSGDAPLAGNDATNLGTISETLSGDTSGNTLQLSVGAAYDLMLDGPFYFAPYASLDYYTSDIDGYTETSSRTDSGLPMVFGDQEIESTRAKIGARFGRSFSMDWGVMVPYARGAAVFELSDDEQAIQVRYAAAPSAAQLGDNSGAATFDLNTNPADENSFEFAAGIASVWSNGVSGFVEVDTIAGVENVDHAQISVGLRFER